MLYYNLEQLKRGNSSTLSFSAGDELYADSGMGFNDIGW